MRSARFRKFQGGYVLITVVVAMFLVATIAVMLTHSSAINANTASTELETARAEYVAQAGMQHALWRAQNNACMGDVTIPATTLGPGNYTATITGAAAGTAYTLTADQDAWIDSDDESKNNGDSAKQHIGFDFGEYEHALTRFDLSSLPANARINSANAWFYVNGGGAHPQGPVTVHSISADWTETGATWKTMNGKYESSVLATIPAQPDDDVWVQINLTAQVQAWVNGQPNYGILMASATEGVNGLYSSREDGSHAPRLEVVVGSGPASPVAIQATGTLDTGITRTLSRPLTAAYQPPVMHSFTPDPAESEDAEIWDQAPNNNYGNAAETWVSSASNDTTRTLLRFNMGAIPAGARILEATLSLQRQSGSGADQPVSAHRILNSWREDSVTWYSREPGKFWDTAGGDFNAAAVTTTPVGPDNERYEWDITPLAQGWVNGSYPNYGVALVAAIAGMPGERFYTSDQSDLTRRPGLSVSYACECGSPCMAPQGSGSILMIVGNKNAPGAGDQTILSYFESWGYKVTLISDGESASAFNNKFVDNDVVFISESVAADVLGAKISSAKIGVVSAEGNLNDELGLSTSRGTPVGDSIDVIDNSHYITRVFPAGPLPFKTAATELQTVAGSVAPAAQPLADIGGAGALVALDAGLPDVGGGTANGRRVLVPVGEANVDWRYLTADARLIVQRALAWGMNTDKGTAGNLLMVAVNPFILSAQEQAKKALLESWGYTVNLIDQSDSQSEFDTALATNDVVFVTEDVTANTVSTKLTAAGIGVVTEETNLSDELGLSAGIAWDSGINIEINDNTHYITQPFATGLLNVLSTSESLAYVTGAQSADLQKLASSSSGYGVVTLEAGATTHTGGSAAGRRVMLPWGGNNMDVAHLTADGLTIFQRALKWAAGAGATATPVKLLLVAVDSTNLSAQEEARKTQLESWGYSITLIDSAESQTNFDVAVAANDVLYVTKDIDRNKVKDKIPDYTIGIVNENRALHPALGLSSVDGQMVDTDRIEITDNSHYITSTFSAGWLTICTSNQKLTRTPGDLGGATFIADTDGTGEPAMSIFMPGDALEDGRTAAGRRVFLPWGDDDVDFNTLNANGLEIMRRSIEWAAGAGDDATGPIAHWKLDDGTGLTAVDTEGGHDGTLVNGPAWVAGQLGDALDFDNSNDYVDLTSDAELDDVFVGGATVMTWIYPSGWGENGYGRVFDKSSSASSTGDGWVIRMNIDNGGIINFGQGFSGGRGWWKIPNGSINLNTWQHIAVAYNAADTANDPVIYLDGSPVAVIRVDAPSGTVRSDAAINLRLGNFAAGTSHTFDGKIDDARIYDRMLSDAEIAEIAAAGGGGGGGGGGGCDGTFRDEFNATSFSGSNGTLAWAGDWLEVGESNGAGQGDIRVMSNLSNTRLRTRDNDNGGEGVEREADLSGAASATLNYNYRRMGLDSANDYTSVAVSANGATGPWTELTRHQGSGNDGSYQSASHNISAYISANTRIRFKTSSSMGGQDTVWFDNIEIACSP